MIAKIRDGLAANLETVFGVNVYRRPPSHIVPPAAIVLRGAYDPTRDYDQSVDYTFTVTVAVQLGTFDAAITELDSFADPDKLVAAVESDQTLGGNVSGVQVTSVGPEGIQAIGGHDYATFDLSVTVIA
jgi:hypothetical protein